MSRLFGTAGGLGIGAVIGAVVGGVVGFDFDVGGELVDTLVENDIQPDTLLDALAKVDKVDPFVDGTPLPNMHDGLIEKYDFSPSEVEAYTQFVENVDQESFVSKLSQATEKLASSMSLGTLIGGGTGAVAGYNIGANRAEKS